MIISENTRLTERQKSRVLASIEDRGFTCESCHSGDLRVSEALHMGFLFLDEEHGTYMVALTCKNPDCAAPRTGIRLRHSEFLWVE